MLALGKLYRLTQTTIAITSQPDGRKTAIHIPANDIVQLVEHDSTHSMVVVDWNETKCELFTEDLRRRGEEFDPVGQSPVLSAVAEL